MTEAKGMAEGHATINAPHRADSANVAAAKAALGAGAMAFLFAAVMPVAWLESLVYQAYLDTIVPMAKAPLGMTARMIFAFIVAAICAVLVFALHRVLSRTALLHKILARFRKTNDNAHGAPMLRRADAHPDAPSRAPIMAETDLDLPGLMSGLSVNDLRDAKPAAGGLSAPPPKMTNIPGWAYQDEAMATEVPPRAIEEDPLDLAEATALLAARNAAVEQEEAERRAAADAAQAALVEQAEAENPIAGQAASVSVASAEEWTPVEAAADDDPLELGVLDEYTDALDDAITEPEPAFAHAFTPPAELPVDAPSLAPEPVASPVYAEGDKSLAAMVARLEAGLAERKSLATRPMVTMVSSDAAAPVQGEEPAVDFALEAALSTLNRMSRRAVG